MVGIEITKPLVFCKDEGTQPYKKNCGKILKHKNLHFLKIISHGWVN